MPGFEIIEHTADYALRARGRDLRELIENAGLATIAIMVDTTGLAPETTRAFCVTGRDREELVVRALRELVRLEDDEGLTPVHYRVESAVEGEVRAVAGCVPFAEARERRLGAVKAVTYHNLHVREVEGGLEVEVVLDT